MQSSAFRGSRPAYLILVLLLAAATGHANVRAIESDDLLSRRATCDFPVRLAHDCSIWQGASRPIAFGDYRMSLAAAADGRTILVSRLRHGPDHNGRAFHGGKRLRSGRALQAIRLIGQALRARGIELERIQPLHRGQRVAGYYLEFSANAYDYLKQFTVLESEYWLPNRQTSR